VGTDQFQHATTKQVLLVILAQVAVQRSILVATLGMRVRGATIFAKTRLGRRPTSSDPIRTITLFQHFFNFLTRHVRRKMLKFLWWATLGWQLCRGCCCAFSLVEWLLHTATVVGGELLIASRLPSGLKTNKGLPLPWVGRIATRGLGGDYSLEKAIGERPSLIVFFLLYWFKDALESFQKSHV
jgi:hypothetical protein